MHNEKITMNVLSTIAILLAVVSPGDHIFKPLYIFYIFNNNIVFIKVHIHAMKSLKLIKINLMKILNPKKCNPNHINNSTKFISFIKFIQQSNTQSPLSNTNFTNNEYNILIQFKHQHMYSNVLH